ncbi:peptidylprolyl isomerase [Planosporangium flavigriseum]|nr:peptidylprolyl isomerase [Planosporangium flavigriseum]NJC66281.1 peptidylprolyl isomerase [Planosporangium flavigriseum]
MTLRAEAAQRRRRLQASIGAGAAVLVLIVGVVLIVTLTGNDKKRDNTAAPASSASATPTNCQWNPSAKTGQPANPAAKDVGTPPATGEPRTGTQTMTITTNVGVVTAQIDTAKAPCTAASFTHLAGKKFFDNTPCHRLTTQGIYVLQCGDPSGTGTGGPAYQFANENLPTDKRPAYPAGTIAMANSGPDTNGSQFFIVYKDTELQPDYTVFGKVTQGLDVVQKVAEGGVDDTNGPGDGGPKTKVTIQSLTMGAPAQS